MKKFWWSVFMLAGVFFVFGGVVQAEITWMYVQHRVYENGNSLNRINFGFVDQYGEALTSPDAVSSAVLYDPNGNMTDMSSGMNFWTDNYISESWYDAGNSIWHYGNEWKYDSGFTYDLSDALIPGDYRLLVTGNGGQTYEYYCVFEEQVSLPVFSSNSFRVHKDAAGNLHWTWDIPNDLPNDSGISVRPVIEIYKNGNYWGYLTAKIPAHMGYMYIPQNIVQDFNSRGDEFRIRIQLRTNNNNNRTYSDYLPMSELTATPPALAGGYEITSDVWIKAVHNITGVGQITLRWQQGKTDISAAGDKTIWGYFYADPADFVYGSPANPEAFAKIYIATNGWVNIAFNHVSVDPIDVYSSKDGIDQSGTISIDTRVAAHPYNP